MKDKNATSSLMTVGTDHIVDAIEEDIVLGRLSPKERLVEEDLIERFDCKRHVVRQALFQLETIGLVERIKNRGAFVRTYTPEEVEQLYAMRELLEIAGAESIALPVSEATLQALVDIQTQHSEAVAEQDLHRVFRLNIAFHRALFSATGNSYLSECINEFAQKAHSIRFVAMSDPESLKHARDEHLAMIEALKAQDREWLCTLCKQHLLPSKERYLRLARFSAR
ncbi:GntR family transcriptional regulator [Vreelandella sp. TE19]